MAAAFPEFDSMDVARAYYLAFEQTVAGSWAGLVGRKITDANQEISTYPFLGHAPRPTEKKAATFGSQPSKYSFTVTNKEYTSSIDLPRVDIERDKTGQFLRLVSELGQKASLVPEKLLSDLIIANPTCYDSQNFFDTDHSSGDSGTQVNAATSSHVPSADVGTATAPTPTEAANIIGEGIGLMQSWLDDKGDPINGQAQRFVVMSGTYQIHQAIQNAVALPSLVSGATNPLANRVLSGQINLDVRYNNYLAAKTAQIYIFRVDGPTSSFIWQDETPPEETFLGPGTDYYTTLDRYLFKVYMRQGAGVANWENALQITMS